MNDTAYKAITRARNQAAGGNPKGAAQTLEDYLATDPHNTEPRIVLANIALKDMKDERYGLLQLDIVLDLDPDNLTALKAKASYLAQDKRNNKETAELFERIVSKDTSPEVCSEYARFLRNQLTDFPKAGEWYERAIAGDPSNYAYHQNYAVLLLNDLKDYQKARTELETLLEMKPNDQSIRSNYDKLMRTKFDKDGNLRKSKSIFGKKHRPLDVTFISLRIPNGVNLISVPAYHHD